MLSTVPAEPFDSEFQVQFRMEVTDAAGTQIGAVEAGKEFAVNVYVVDQRPLPQGVFAAYLDLVFDHSLVEKTGNLTFGESYTNALASGGATPGVLDEVGAVVASLFDADHAAATTPDSLLFRVPFRALDAGPVTFLTEPADHFPDSYVLLFGINHPVELADIEFDAKTLDITRPVAPPFLATFNPAKRDFDATFASSLRRDWPLSLETDVFSRLITTRPERPDNSLASSAPKFSTPHSGIDVGDEPWRFSDVLPREPLSSLPALSFLPRMTDDESNWIELPLQLFSNGDQLPSREFSGRQSLLPHDVDPTDELPRFSTRSYESILQSDSTGHDRKRTFLRMNWIDWEENAFNTCELLSARMIDIDEVFARGDLLDRLESNSEELFADGLDPKSSDAMLDDQLQVSRGTSLAIEVGVGSSDGPRVEPSTNSDMNGDSDQADAGPPKPKTNSPS